MKKINRKITIVIAIVAAALIALAVLVRPQRKTLTDTTYSHATITDITRRVNMAENGYYGIDLQDSQGNKYLINATGYMNTPLSPSERGEDCADVPDLGVGDKLEFNLPKGSEQDGVQTYVVCYKKGTGHYFIKKDVVAPL